MAHTAGKWETKPENEHIPAQVWCDGRQLAEVYGEDRATRAENALLMAAAPEMLKALQGILHHDWATKPKLQLPASLVREVENAITKATKGR
jgi:hypothetical protein